MVDGPFSCAPHKFATDGTKDIADQEDDWYQHLRDEVHDYRLNGKCENCGKKVHYDSIKLKVPVKRKAPFMFCDNADKCRKEYLAKMGMTT